MGLKYSYQLAWQNLQDLACILRWNYQNGIQNYRMSSEMFPFATHPDYFENYDLDQFAHLLAKIGQLSLRFRQRLTFHPGQYNQLTSQREAVVAKAIVDIDFHCRVMDMMNLDHHSVVIIHGGSKQDGQEIALGRFRSNFARLSTSSQQRLVLENCELAYAIQDLLPMCNELSIPIVIDYHHHAINPGTVPLSNLTEQVLQIWLRRDITPLFHVSESRPGVTLSDNVTVRRAHSDYVLALPAELLKIVHTTRISVDIEAKMKEQAVLVLFDKYEIRKIDPKMLWPTLE
jgi:UV DNA damage endonuclease